MTDPLIAVFRTEASSSIGSGHVMRCLTLADGLKARGWHCVFASAKDTMKTVPMLVVSGFDMIDPDKIAHIKPDLLIVDHYGLDSKYEAAARAWAKKIAVLDDLADRPHDCDLLIDQTYGRSADDYRKLTPIGCRILAGTDYTLLRPQFAKARAEAEERRFEDNSVRRILVAVGSTNYNNIVTKLLEGLVLVTCGGLQIDVVLSSGAENLADVSRAISALNSKGLHSATLHLDVQDMASLMLAADIAIGAGGTTTWERCCLGLPTLMVELADNQIPTIQALTEAGAIIPMGRAQTLDSEDIAGHVQKAVTSPDLLKNLSRASFKICDGIGLERSVAALEGLVHKALTLRPADLKDSQNLLVWRNDERTRAFSINTDIIDSETHEDWFSNIFTANPVRIFIVENGGVPVGSIRRDFKDDGVYLSWMVNPEYRGQGIGEGMLSLFLRSHPDSYKALIKEENKASIHIAEKCGFARSGVQEGLLMFQHNG